MTVWQLYTQTLKIWGRHLRSKSANTYMNVYKLAEVVTMNKNGFLPFPAVLWFISVRKTSPYIKKRMLDHYFKLRNWKGTINKAFLVTIELHTLQKILCSIKCLHSTQRARNIFQNNSECNYYNTCLVVSNIILHMYSPVYAISKNSMWCFLRLKRCQTNFFLNAFFDFTLQKFKCTFHFILDP